MNISSIGGADGATAVGANQNDFRTKMQQSLAPVAQLFGMSTDQLMSAVKDSGKSLADYAASKGVSSTDLTAAIKQGLQANAPNGVQLSDTQLTNLAQRIENHKPGDRPQGPPPNASIAATSSRSTSALKAEVEKLLEDLKANQSSSASTTGVSSTSSTSTMKTDLEKLLADLKASDADSAGSSTTSSSGSGSVSANALIDVLTRFDQQL